MHFLFSPSLVQRDSIPNTCSILTFSLVLLLACTGLHLMYIILIHRETIICWHAVCPYAQAHKTRQPAIGILLCLLTYASRKAVGLHSPVVGSGLSRQILSPFHQNLSANQSLCKKIYKVVIISQNEFHILSFELLILCYYQFSTIFHSPTQCLRAYPAGAVQYQTGANVHLVMFRATVQCRNGELIRATITYTRLYSLYTVFSSELWLTKSLFGKQLYCQTRVNSTLSRTQLH